MALVQIDNVSRIYQTGEVQVKALQDVTLSIDEASFVTFVGPSGSGKTTMLNLIGCLDKPTKGKVFIGKEQVDTFDRRHRAAFRGSTLGFIFQAFNLFQVLTTYENVEYPLVMIKNECSIEFIPHGTHKTNHIYCRFFIQVCSWLVCKNKFWLCHQSPRHRDSLLLTS